MPGVEDQGFDLPAGEGGQVCVHCGRPPARGARVTLLLPDSSVMAPASRDASLDGQRLVTACGHDHAAVLVRQARGSWVDEQWWFGRLCRASLEPGMRYSTLPSLRERARLSLGQLRAALDWNAGQASRRTVLPGGQPLPAGAGGPAERERGDLEEPRSSPGSRH